MKLTADQREAVNDIIIDAFQTPKFFVYTRNECSILELNPVWSFNQDPSNETVNNMIFRQVFRDEDHKKSAILMRDIMNADEITKRIEAVI